MDIVLLNGALLPRDDAHLGIGDRGLLFGDGLFETILIHEGVPYLIQRHLQRLLRGVEFLQIGYDASHLEEQIATLIKANKVESAVLRITLTRGEGSKGYLPHPDMKGTRPTLIGELRALPGAPTEETRLIVSRLRKTPASCLPGDIKHLQGLNSTLARMEAARAGAQEAILLDVRGYLAECSSHNLFWSRGRTLYTPHLGTGCLAGIMRQRIMELSGYRVREGFFTLGDLARADAVLLTNSVSLVMPVHGIQELELTWKNSDKLAKIYMMSLEQDIASDTADTRERYRAQGWL